MKKNTAVVFALIVCITIVIGYSCAKESRWDCIKRTGNISMDTRLLPPFTKIYVNDNIDVFLTQGNTQEVKVESGNNLISLIKTEVMDGVLYISNHNRCNWARNYQKGAIKVYITLPVLRFIWHFGSGFVSAKDTIRCDTLDVWAHQTGDVELTVNANIIYTNMHTTADLTLHGKSGTLAIWHVGEGYLHCEDLRTNISWSASSASGDEYLNVQDYLAVSIDWEGNIYYSGNPATSSKGDGKGKLIREN